MPQRTDPDFRKEAAQNYKGWTIRFCGYPHLDGTWDDSCEIRSVNRMRFAIGDSIFKTKEEAIASAMTKGRQWVDSQNTLKGPSPRLNAHPGPPTS
jgi:hypothetical protein